MLIDLHAQAICRAARAGKHIFCEKPVAFSPGPIREALAAVHEAGVQLQVGFNRRFDPSLLKLQQAVRDGVVGELQGLRIINRDPKRRTSSLFSALEVSSSTSRFTTSTPCDS